MLCLIGATALGLARIEVALPLSVLIVGCLAGLAIGRIVLMERRVMTAVRSLGVSKAVVPMTGKPSGSAANVQGASSPAAMKNQAASPLGVGGGTKSVRRGDTGTSQIASPVIGRQAADVAIDTERHIRLDQAIGARFGSDSVDRRRLAIIGTKSLFSTLSGGYVLESVHPSTARAQLSVLDASALIIDQNGLSQGPWGGVQSAGETHLANELFWLIDYMRGKDVPVYFVPSSASPDVYTFHIMSKATLIIGDDTDYQEWGEDLRLPLIDSLNAYAKAVTL